MFLCEIAKNSQEKTVKVFEVMKKAFKVLEANKFRPFLIALYHLSQINDDIDDYRMNLIMKTLEDAFEANRKFFSECDILLQWVYKLCVVNQAFKRKI